MGSMSSPRDGSSSDETGPEGDGPSSSGQSSDRSARASPGDDLDSGPTPQYPDGGERTDAGSGVTGSGPLALVRRFRNSDNGVVVFVREMLSSAGIVIAIGLVLFAISGVWPPMVAIESGSMEPHMVKGDLVFIMEEGRLAPAAAHADTGVVTYKNGKQAGYKKFESYGDVIVYKPDGKS